METNELIEVIKNAQRYLIGIGEDVSDDPKIQDEIYLGLSEFLEDKDFFIVTMKTDDRIYRYFPGKEDRISSPMGNRRYIQCPDGCDEALYEVTEVTNEGITHYNKECNLVTEMEPKCPTCGKTMVYNNFLAPVFLGEGCAKDWDHYNEWLTRTLNRKLIILELESGMLNPKLIRWPFEKVAMLNEKAVFVRVHSSLNMLPKELSSKAVAVKSDSLSFLQKHLIGIF